MDDTRMLSLIDPDILRSMVVEVLESDADLADQAEEKLAQDMLQELETPAFARMVVTESPTFHALNRAQQECRLRIAPDGSARATWLTVQVEGDEAVLHVGIG